MSQTWACNHTSLGSGPSSATFKTEGESEEQSDCAAKSARSGVKLELGSYRTHLGHVMNTAIRLDQIRSDNTFSDQIIRRVHPEQRRRRACPVESPLPSAIVLVRRTEMHAEAQAAEGTICAQKQPLNHVLMDCL